MKSRLVIALSVGLCLAGLAVVGSVSAAVPRPPHPDAPLPDRAGGLASFDCSGVSEIPLAECQALVALYDSSNGAGWADHTSWLQTQTPCTWSGVWCTAGHVQSLNLAGNLLTGSLPAALGNLTSLQDLALSNNQLSGSIPAELGNLTGLVNLFLDGNLLTGSIPSQLGNLTGLLYLFLDGNQLSGAIPPELGNLTSLYYLYLSNNQLSGSVPAQLGGLTNLSGLYLSNNQLSGALPMSLTDLSLSAFWFDGTSLCEPDDPEFQGWLANILDLHRTGVTCLTRCVAVQYQGHGPAGTARWALPIRVTVRPAGQTTIVYSQTLTTNHHGQATVSLAPDTPASIDVEVKNAHTLSRLQPNVSLASWTQCLSMGLLPEGDANDNNAVEILDFSLLRAHYGEVCPGCDPRADFNEDGEIGALDFSLLRTNYGVSGPVQSLP